MKTTLLFLFILLTYNFYGQVEEGTQARATLIPLGIDLETKISDTKTINLDAGLQPSAGITIASDSNTTETDSYFAIHPLLQVSLREYYNFEKRAEKGKKTSGNSGNYVGILAQGLFGEITTPDADENPLKYSYSFGAIWGFQRTYDSNIYLDLNLGLGYELSDYEFETPDTNKGVAGIGSFAIGYAFGQN